MASPQRLGRIQGQMLKDVSDIVHQMQDPRVQGVNISEVVVSKDLSYATVYVSVIGEEDIQRSALTALRRAAGHIRQTPPNVSWRRMCRICSQKQSHHFLNSL